MTRLNIHQIKELDKMMPDLHTADDKGTGFLAVSIRDVQLNYWNPTSETTIAMHLDGVQLTRFNG